MLPYLSYLYYPDLKIKDGKKKGKEKKRNRKKKWPNIQDINVLDTTLKYPSNSFSLNPGFSPSASYTV